MLVLTRKRSQTIRIDDHIVIKVIQIGKRTVKIGIEAPAEVKVLRSELCTDQVPDQPLLSLAEILRQRQGVPSVVLPPDVEMPNG
jgi:carbon storage regulator